MANDGWNDGPETAKSEGREKWERSIIVVVVDDQINFSH